MFPAPFDYLAPRSLEEALALLAERGEDVKVLAGGQSLIPMMKLRFATPGTLVDINRVPGIGFITDGDGELRIGALARHNEVAGSATVARCSHTVAAAAPWVADPIVRNLGTIGGSLAHADPEGDWSSVMLACDAQVVATSRAGARVVPMTEFLLDMFTTALRPDELITEVRIPKCEGPAGGAYLKLERKIGDYATAAVAVQLELATTGRIARAGIALTSVAPRNTKATDAEQLLVGEEPSAELFAEAAEAAARAADPKTDVRGPAEYKRDVVRVFVRRGLAQALETARAA